MGKKPQRKSCDSREARSPTPDPSLEGRITAGKNRLTQITRTGTRKLFDAARRELFLEWFAATCNVKLSAEKAGVAYQTVFKHRMKDAAFAAAWDEALQQGYAYLEARLLQEAIAPHPAHAAHESPSPARGEGLEEEAEKHFDPQLAITILREHARRLPGSPDKTKAFRPTHRVASNEEVREALVKRLKAFALRQGSGQALRQGSLRGARAAPTPSPRSHEARVALSREGRGEEGPGKRKRGPRFSGGDQ